MTTGCNVISYDENLYLHHRDQRLQLWELALNLHFTRPSPLHLAEQGVTGGGWRRWVGASKHDCKASRAWNCLAVRESERHLVCEIDTQCPQALITPRE